MKNWQPLVLGPLFAWGLRMVKYKKCTISDRPKLKTDTQRKAAAQDYLIFSLLLDKPKETRYTSAGEHRVLGCGMVTTSGHTRMRKSHVTNFLLYFYKGVFSTRLFRSPGSRAHSWKKAELFRDKYLLAAALSWGKLKGRNQGKKENQLISVFWEVSSK